MFYIQQTSEAGCGFACLKMVLANIRKDKRYLFLSEKEDYPLSYKEIIALAKEQGLNLCGFRASKKDEIQKHTKFPVIVTLCAQEGVNHAVVVAKIKRGKVYILDPDTGIYKLPIIQFLNLWDGTGLLIESDDGGTFKENIEEPNKKKDYIISSILQFVSGLFCIFGVYFINKSEYLWLSIVFFCLFVITELVHKIVLFKEMDKVDKFFLKDLNIKQDNYHKFFVRLEDYKKQSLANPISFATYFFVVAFLVYIAIANSLWNLLLVMVPLLLALFNRVVVIPRQEMKEKEIAKEEMLLGGADSISEYKVRTKSIHKKAYLVGKEMLALRYFNILIMVATALLVIMFLKEFALTQVVFYVVMEVVLFDYLSKLFSFSQKEKDYNLAKAKLFNVIHQKDENN